MDINQNPPRILNININYLNQIDIFSINFKSNKNSTIFFIFETKGSILIFGYILIKIYLRCCHYNL